MTGDARRLERVIDLLPQAVTVVDAQGRLVIRNRAAEELTGASEASDLETSFVRSFLRHVNGEPYALEETPIMRSLRGEVVTEERALFQRGGRRIAMIVSSAPLLDAGGTTEGAIALYRDVSEEVRRQQERTELIATLTHDLGNPLFAVTVAIQLALRRLPAEATQIREALERAEAQTAKMARLVKDLAELGRAESAPALRRERLDLCAFARERLAASKEAARVDLECSGTAVVEGDRERLGQLLDNLVGNGLKFSVERVGVRIEQRDGQAVLLVSDKGIGVPEGERERIFEPYARTERSRSYEGSGVGLYVSRLIAVRHGGRIWLESSGESGSTFAVSLPLANDAEGEVSPGA